MSELRSDGRSESVEGRYVIDTRPLCQGMQFMLTDAVHPRIVLKHGSHFLVLDEAATIPACNTLGYGYYRHDTRHISQWELSLDNVPLSVLSSVTSEGYAGSFLYTNPQTDNLLQQKVTILREIVLADHLWERIALENFHTEAVTFELKMNFQSDFADMFEVRGLNRPSRGKRMVPLSGANGQSLFLGYRGVDGILVETVVEFSGIRPDSIIDGEVIFRILLPVRQVRTFELCVTTRWDGQAGSNIQEERDYASAKAIADARCQSWYERVSRVATANELFNVSLKRGLQDVYILRQPTPKGYGLAAGIPWYCAVFGRDSAITALQMLPFAPDLGRECIEVLAAYQGQCNDDYKAEGPGKIMHELRLGELARSRQVPHSPYYGTVDATQLWLLLFCQYIHWTGDLSYARQLWPAVKQAISWLDKTTNGGYITYQRVGDQGLENQGWKDSGDAVMHTDGSLAEPPIAICEAQGYLYAARRELARIADMLGHRAMTARLLRQATELKEMFQRDFWMESEKFIALALDRDGHQVAVVSSNPGHCLATGILNDEKAEAVADRLMSEQLHTGWGIRTLSSSVVAFNPISYHNGSVWPHDNAIIAEGLRKMGRVSDFHKIMRGLFDVAQYQPNFRLPELFCGFEKKEATGPINYPVSCSPQAWAAGSMFQLLRSCMNLEPDACNGRIRLIEPSLPDWLETVMVRGLQIGGGKVDFNLVNTAGSTSCQILRKSGNVRVIIES